jgi:hypothetical protein
MYPQGRIGYKDKFKQTEEKLRIAEQISEARKKALELIAVQPRSRGLTDEVLHVCDLAARGMREGRTPSGGNLVEVAIGTPLSCDPTSETYWSM